MSAKSKRPIRVTRTDKRKGSGVHFARIDNVVLQNSGLSYGARGIMAYVLSMPPDWEHSAESLAALSTGEGWSTIRARLRELEKAGFAHFRKVRGPAGHFQNAWFFREAPTAENQRSEGGGPSAENLKSVNGSTGGQLSDAGLPGAGPAEAGKLALSETTMSETTVFDKIDKIDASPTVVGPARGKKASNTKAAKPGTPENPLPIPSRSEFEDYAYSIGMSEHGIEWFLSRTELYGWTVPDVKGRRQRMFNWKLAVERWWEQETSRPPPSKDKTTNDEFWAWVDKHDVDRDAVSKWIELNERNGWHQVNKRTGRREPIKDYRASLSAFVNKVLPYAS